jgi:arylsulfatase A-like enzyme
MLRALSSLLFCASVAAVASVSLAAEKPNVVFVVSDDQRFDTIHALGNNEIRTPNLDKLVERGFTFTHNFCMGAMQGAVCVPTRAMFLSGRSLFRVDEKLPADVPLFPEVMGKAGYATFASGKWHNGKASFARAFGNSGPVFFGGMGNQFKLPYFDYDPSGKYEPNRQKIGDVYSTEMFLGAARKFVKEYKGDKPFFLYVPLTSPHDPRTAPGEFASMYDPAKIPLPPNYLPLHPFNNGEMTIRDEALAPWPRTPSVVKQHIADYYAMISHLDRELGLLLDALKETDREKNTLVIFTGDHGLAVGRHGLFGKQNLYDHSMRSPLIFAGPGIPAGKKSDALCYLFDIFPTVCQLTGVQAPKGIDGMSLAPVMEGKKPAVRSEIFNAYRNVQRAARTQRWKLIRYPQINKSQLFDLSVDPDETNDLSADDKYKPELEKMTEKLVALKKQFGDAQPLSVEKPAPLYIELPPPKPPEAKPPAAVKAKS